MNPVWACFFTVKPAGLSAASLVQSFVEFCDADLNLTGTKLHISFLQSEQILLGWGITGVGRFKVSVSIQASSAGTGIDCSQGGGSAGKPGWEKGAVDHTSTGCCCFDLRG